MRDEQDIEVLGQTIFRPAADGTPAGIQLTNYQVSRSPNETCSYCQILMIVEWKRGKRFHSRSFPCRSYCRFPQLYVSRATSLPFYARLTIDQRAYISIAWLPTGTKYYFDRTALKSPAKYCKPNTSVQSADFSISQSLKWSVLAMRSAHMLISVIINHWSAGIKGFTEGPPTQDVVMKVKTVSIYYKTKRQSGLPKGCDLAQACRVQA